MHPDDLQHAFDAFEERTRGLDSWPHRVELEPPFRAIFSRERTTRLHLDDSRKPGVWDRLRGRAGTVPSVPDPEIEPAELEPRTEGPRDIAELTLLVPESFVVKGEVALWLLSSLRSIRGRLTLELIGKKDCVWTQLACGENEKHKVSGTVAAYFPEVKVRENPCALADAWQAAGDYCSVLHLGLVERVFHPLRNDARFDVDPLIEVVGCLGDLDDRELGIVQILFEPARSSWGEELVAFVESIDDVDHVLPLVEKKFSEPPFAVVLRVIAQANSAERSGEIARGLAATLHTITRSEDNQLTLVSGGGHDAETEVLDVLDRETRRAGMILSLSELATLVHLPSAAVRSMRFLRQSGRTKSAPATTLGHALILGANEHDGDTQLVSLSPDQRLRHTYAIGASGTGKSTLILSMAAQDIALGNGFAVLDPHGDLVEDILARIPEERAGDVMLFDPADEDYPIGFNILSAHSELERTLLASDLVSVFKRLSTTFGDVMISVLGNAVLAFLESERGGTLLDLRDFLIDPAFRAKILKTVRDEEVVSYWQREFTLLKGVPHAPVLTRLNNFVRPRLLRRMVGQQRDRVDFRHIMDTKTIFLAKLSQGAIGGENSHLLGSLLVAKIAQAAMSRQDLDVAKREPYTLYVDEFHHFVTPSIATILSGARKYGLGLVLAHHEMRQLKAQSEEVASAVLANAATRVVFRVGEQDAKTLAEGFAFFESKDLQSLSVGEAIARVERADFDFNLLTHRLDPVDPQLAAARRSAAAKASRESYAIPKAEIDAVLAAARSTPADSGEERQSPRSVRGSNEKNGEGKLVLPGRGGAEHKYIQDLIKRLGEERGFVVSIEKRILGGHGHVDVALERDGLSIGCEISMTTRATHEIGNIAKLIAAGFDYAVLVTSKERVRKVARETMGDGDSNRMRFLTPEGFVAFLEEVAPVAQGHKRRSRTNVAPARQEKTSGLIAADRAAAYLGIRTQTLAKMRVEGSSPPFHKIGSRVLYDVAELDAWIAARKRRSTSDAPRT
jgi:hypothetical protein